ncbi:MAG: hypothetical protein PQJ59_13515 [Spirochaetales bacterium]|nr:hypothetical protein [Spirochaetales bacterium]
MKIISLTNLILFLSLFPIIAQGEELMDHEREFIQILESEILPFDSELGFIDEENDVNSLVTGLFENGPDGENCIDEMIFLNQKKFDYLNWDYEKVFNTKVSSIDESENKLRVRYIVESQNYKIKGTMYLTRLEDKWFLYDFSGENQEISNP